MMFAHANHHLDLRRRVTEATYARFHGRALVWGTDDCVRMAAYALARFGRKPRLSRFGAYSNETGALRALKRAGFASVTAVLDDLGLLRIPPAMMLPGDILMLDGDSPLGALTLALGNHRVLGWHEDTGTCVVIQPTALTPETPAWRA